MNLNLPVESLRNQMIESLVASGTLILQAPPGSGKSTLVPQYLLDEVVRPAQRVWVLQPRRMATRLLARFVAGMRNGKPGDEVGYQIKHERMAGPGTRLLFVTEGILLRRLLSGDHLTELGAIVLDEFHERHAETDITLALARQLQSTHRPDLKIVVMSATLDTTILSEYLPESRIIRSDGRLFPVKIHYTPARRDENIWDAAATQLEHHQKLMADGVALVFMPGAYEIRRTLEAIGRRDSLSSWAVCPLHGLLPKAEQDEAVRGGTKKIIVSTNVAETSLTIPGVTLVIDSGLARVARFDARRETDTLYTEHISQSAADQRAGRAGRTTSGTCIRLWSEFHHQHLAPYDSPEIHRIDPGPVILGLMGHPEAELATFPWIEPPKPEAVSSALNLLSQLGAITADMKITDTGRQMARLPIHPRYARLLTECQQAGCIIPGALAAALGDSPTIFLPSTDPLVRDERVYTLGRSGSDLIGSVNALIYAASCGYNPSRCQALGIHPMKAQQVMQTAAQLLRIARTDSKLPDTLLTEEETALLRRCIFTAFSDRIAVRPDLKTMICRLPGGRKGRLNPDSTVQDARLMVVTDMEEGKSNNETVLMLRQVTAIELEWITGLSTSGFDVNQSVMFDKRQGKVVRMTEVTMDDLLFERRQTDDVTLDEAATILADGVMTGEISYDGWDAEAETFINRVNFASVNAPHYAIPAIDHEARRFILQQCFYGCRTTKELSRTTLKPALREYLSTLQMSAVDAVAPETVNLPHRHRPVRLRYDDKGSVILSETIQAFYDCPTPITVAEGRVEVLYELLSPARRPVQLTRSLDKFWTGSYPEIRKQLKGRYPKHEWR